jgi:hypothetical protein
MPRSRFSLASRHSAEGIVVKVLPVIALLHASDPAYIRERPAGVFATSSTGQSCKRDRRRCGATRVPPPGAFGGVTIEQAGDPVARHAIDAEGRSRWAHPPNPEARGRGLGDRRATSSYWPAPQCRTATRRPTVLEHPSAVRVSRAEPTSRQTSDSSEGRKPNIRRKPAHAQERERQDASTADA